MHGEAAGQTGLSDGQGEQVDEDEDLKHLANVLAKGLDQSSCYYRLSMILYRLVKFEWIGPKVGLQEDPTFRGSSEAKEEQASAALR